MTSPPAKSIPAPMTRLQALVLVRQTLRTLLGHIPNPEMRAAAGRALEHTSHVLADVRPAHFGWAIRPAGDSNGTWKVEFDIEHVRQCTEALDEAGRPRFEVISLAAMPTVELGLPVAAITSPGAGTTTSEAA